MTNQKLPPYFEKYFEQKFGEININFGELKSHVNDEIQLIRVAIEKLEKKTSQNFWALVVLFVLLLIHDIMKVSLLDIFLKLFS